MELSIHPSLVTQVTQYLAASPGERQIWETYIEENRFVPQTNRQRERAAKPPSPDPAEHTAAFLMRFLRSRDVAPQTGAPDHLALSVALMSTNKVEQVLDFCGHFQNGLVPVNILLAFNLICKFL